MLNNHAKYDKSAIISKILDFNVVFVFLLGFDFMLSLMRKLESYALSIFILNIHLLWNYYLLSL